jgi:hypothetical protein
LWPGPTRAFRNRRRDGSLLAVDDRVDTSEDAVVNLVPMASVKTASGEVSASDVVSATEGVCASRMT